ncbi:MAG: GNAT family N-acetyltransferase [Sphingosinicella sp.]|nr:GNAT family N-acetyltransferase [Sphingosinicella sp.]
MFEIREAVYADANRLIELVEALGFDISFDLLEENLAALAGQGLMPMVADAGGVIGCVTYNIMPVLHRPAPVGRISMLVVTSSWRGQGVGRALIEAALERLRNRGCHLCEVTINLSLVDAHAFYERLGFQKTSVRLGHRLISAQPQAH